MVPKGIGGRIEFQWDQLPKSFPEDFWPGLTRLRRTLSREVEAGCRPVIAWFLAAAVGKARILFSDPRLAIHSEVKIPSVQIPNVGLVGGKLDFLLAHVKGDGPMGTPDVFTVAYSNRSGYGRIRRAPSRDRERTTFFHHRRS
jgi:hypothetical protein